MKPLKTKAQIRAELEKEVENFLSSGGNVSEIARGISGREDPSRGISAHSTFEPKQPRTLVNDVVNALEQRKKPKISKSLTPKKRARKKLITDDFGEPIRWIWEE